MKQEIINQLRAERDGNATGDSITATGDPLTKYWALRVVANVNRVVGAILIVVACFQDVRGCKCRRFFRIWCGPRVVMVSGLRLSRYGLVCKEPN